MTNRAFQRLVTTKEKTMIIDELIEGARETLTGRLIADVRVGLGYTAVLLDDGGCGLSGTVSEGADMGCTVLPEAGELLGFPAERAAQMAITANPVASSVGVATINAALNRSGQAGPDLLEWLDEYEQNLSKENDNGSTD